MSIIIERVTRNICNILINRPEKRNAFNLKLLDQFRAALKNFEDDKDLEFAIIAGLGGNFSAGYDISEIIDQETSCPNILHIEKMLLPLGTRLSNKKITIAAIDGHAAGFGYELALKCDFRVAEIDSRMGFMNRRFGIPIMNGGTVLLPKLIGTSRALDLVATGAAQMGPDALKNGLLYHLSDIGCSIGRANSLARCLNKFDKDTLRLDIESCQAASFGRDMEMLKAERTRAIEYLKTCRPLSLAKKFLTGEIGRHGNFDQGNIPSSYPEVTL